MEYAEFLKSKITKTIDSGFEVNENDLNPMLFDFQKACTKFYLKKGRAAAFEDCGLGKTAQQLNWAYEVQQHTEGSVLNGNP